MTKTLLALVGGISCIAAFALALLGVGDARVRYPTMLDMTFPEFEAAVKKTDIVLLPIGAIEEHSSHLPLGTDAMNVSAQIFQVQQYLRKAGFGTILGPPLNIG